MNEINVSEINDKLTEIVNRLRSNNKININEASLFNLLNNFFDEYKFVYTNKREQEVIQLIDLFLILTSKLEYRLARIIYKKLIDELNRNNDLSIVEISIKKINNQKIFKSLNYYFNEYKSRVFMLLFLVFFLWILFFSNDETSNKSKTKNGDLDSTFASTNDSLINENKLLEKKNRMLNEGWEDSEIENGVLPNCYNYKPIRGEHDNFLEISAGDGTDVAIKIMDIVSNNCIRYVYVNHGTKFRVKRIPEGIYRLKIAYGKNWMSKVENGKCIGRFLRNEYYKSGAQTFDFNVKYNEDGSYNIPTWTLKLDVQKSLLKDEYNSTSISEEEFNK
jgi:hypothetical protein